MPIYLSYYWVAGKGVMVTVGLPVAVGVLLGVGVLVGVNDGVEVDVFVAVFVGGRRSVGEAVIVGVTEGVRVKVAVGVFVDVSVTVPVTISKVGLRNNVGDDWVDVLANVGLGVAVAEESGASEIAIAPTQ
jgi:hypothetical protein